MRIIIHALCLVLIFLGVGLIMLMNMQGKSEKFNHLGQEKSPYLLQHKDNPVWWHAWGEKAFEAAQKENKPIFLSIGYSTCHWCHVMEKESFENEEVAHLLNQHFISIKVDREEHPDVDKIYMDAVVAMSERGGWPMSVFLTPDLKPFFGGTYFPKLQFMQLLTQVDTVWKQNQTEIQKSVHELTEYLSQLSSQAPDTQEKLDNSIFLITLSQFENQFDATYGGFGGAPKFPPSMSLSLLLRIALRSGKKSALDMAHKTLQSMARGGMYDHLGGGFARYSTDPQWLVPHFEKMLYDNANLAAVYLEAYQLTKKPLYLQVAQETLDYIVRDMTHPEGGFYSAEDADSEGLEGKFYVWTFDELKKILSETDFQLFQKVYGISENGNFEHGTNILNLQKDYDWDIKEKLQGIHKKLFETREKRIHPHKDDKILTAWNGLMIGAFARAFQASQDKKYLIAAQRAAHFIHQNLYKKGELLRRFRDSEAKYSGHLEDYAYLIYGLLQLFESDFDGQWISWVLELQKKQDELFWDQEKGGYFFTSESAPHLIRRSKDYQDGATPNSNGISALSLLKLYSLTLNEEYKTKAEKIFENSTAMIKKYPSAFSQTLIALDYYLDRSKEIALVGKKEDSLTQSMVSFLRSSFLPNKVIVMTRENEPNPLPLTKNKKMIGGQTTAYVCEGGTCQLPTSDLQVFKKQVQEIRKY